MKNFTKKENIIIASTAVIVLIAVIVLLVFSGLRRNAAASVKASLSKPKSLPNIVWLAESTDFTAPTSASDAAGLSAFNQSAQSAVDFGFDTVFLKAEYLYDKSLKVPYKDGTPSDFGKSVSLDSSKLDVIKAECSSLSARSLNVILSVDIMSYDSVISALAAQNICGGFIVTGCSDYPAEIVNERLLTLMSKVKTAGNAYVVYADFDSVEGIDKIAFDSKHMTYCAAEIFADNTNSNAYLERFNALLSSTDVGLVAGFRCERVCNDNADPSADGLLRQVVGADGCSKLAARAFSSLRDFTENRDNSASVVTEYIRSGIDLDKTLTPLSLDGEQSVKTEDESYTFRVGCSDKFPIYINEYRYGSVGDTFCNITVDLRHGENEIKVRQNGKTVTLNVECTKKFDGELVSFITPSDSAYYNGKQTVQITVGSFYKATLKAKLGDTELELKPLGNGNGDYVVFSASVKLPKSGKKIRDMGSITVEATYDGASKIYTGGNIFVNAKSDSVPTQNSGSQLAERHASYSDKVTVSGKNLTPYSDNGVQGTANFIMVSAPTAETFPSDPSSPYYDPTLCLWAQGTIDRVVGESEYTNGDGDTFNMYNLASGRRIVKEDVTYIPSGHELPENSVSAVLADSSNGLEVSISTLWRVPYSINRYNQDYYSGYEGKKYNVKQHTVSVIDLVFFNTPNHSGKVDASGSGIVEKAEWVKDAAPGTSILRFYLKKQGGFYGCTVNYDNSGNMRIHFKQPKSSLSGKVIIIDPGHGGVQTGATGMNGTVYEAHQTLKISKYLAEYLSRAGAAVYMTRTEDVDVSLEARRRMTEQVDPELFVSIHLNAAKTPDRSGTCTFYYKAFSQPLAKCIHNRLTEAYRKSCYNDNAKMYAAIDNGANYYPFYVTRTDICPSVLVEVGFITNDLECAYLKDDAYQQVFAQAIYLGIADYVAENNR